MSSFVLGIWCKSKPLKASKRENSSRGLGTVREEPRDWMYIYVRLNCLRVCAFLSLCDFCIGMKPKNTKKHLFAPWARLIKGGRKATFECTLECHKRFFVERLYDCSMSKRITENTPDVQCFRLAIPNFSLAARLIRKVNSGCTPSTRYMVMLCGIRVPVFRILLSYQKSNFLCFKQVKDEPMDKHSAISLSATIIIGGRETLIIRRWTNLVFLFGNKKEIL